MDILEIMQNRHSIRTYSGERIPDETLLKILKAGLLSESGHGKRPWELIVVREKEMLKKLSISRESGSAKMLSGADAAIIVLADETATDLWTEDASVVMANMHLAASALGVASCWIQGRARMQTKELSTENYLRELLGFPNHLRLEAILSLGISARVTEPKSLEKLPVEKIHYEHY